MPVTGKVIDNPVIQKTRLSSLVERPSLLDQNPLLHPSPLCLICDLIGDMRHDLGMNLASTRARLSAPPPDRFASEKPMLLRGGVCPALRFRRYVLLSGSEVAKIDAEWLRLVAHFPFPASR
jgi:hypothetical protein